MFEDLRIKKILHSRLPERLARRLPPALVELAIGVLMAVAFVALRAPLGFLAGDRAPYALNFLAVVLATVLAGWRSGVVALVVGQALTWYIIVYPNWTVAGANGDRIVGLIIATIAQALILLIIGLYQREVAKGQAERERRMELLQHALREIDHRTGNNYQTVLALIQLQSQRSTDGKVKAALDQVGDRITAIAKASEQMALRSADLESVKLDNHLCELCEHIGRGLSREEVDVDCDVSPCSAPIERAVSISIIVNELVTNALKHAFQDGGSGRVKVIGEVDGKGLQLTVSDNGRGFKPAPSRKNGGLGTKLVDTFVRQLNANHEVISSDNGTTHRIVIPSLQ